MKKTIALVVLALAALALIYAFLTERAAWEAKQLEHDRALSELQGQLTQASASTVAALKVDSMHALQGAVLMAEVKRLRQVGTAPVLLPPVPAAPAPDTCAPWVSALSARVLALTDHNDSLKRAIGLAIVSDSLQHGRADALRAELNQVNTLMLAVRDTLAHRPLPVPVVQKERTRLFAEARAGLGSPVFAAAGVQRGALSVAVTQDLRAGGERRIEVAYRATLALPKFFP